MRLAVDLPGVQLKDLDVINHGVLTIEGFRRTMSVDGSVCVKSRISRRYAIDADVVVLTTPRQISNSASSLSKLLKAQAQSSSGQCAEDDEGDTSAAVTSAMSMQPNMSVARPVTSLADSAAW
jgi:hypothetical protein